MVSRGQNLLQQTSAFPPTTYPLPEERGSCSGSTPVTDKSDRSCNLSITGFSRERKQSMPRRPQTPCKYPGCPKRVPYGRKYCDEHEQRCQGERKNAVLRGYGREWQKARKFFLKRHPWCARCKEKGRLVPATVVDHIKPHRGDLDLFWNEKNWQPLCKSCHDHKTMTEDRDIEYRY